MTRMSDILLRSLTLLLVGFAVNAAQADAISAVQLLREGGCGGILPAAHPLRHNASLDKAAELWATGIMPTTATQRTGYESQSTAAIHVRGQESSLVALLRTNCRALMNQELGDLGIYRRGLDTWLVLASRYAAPTVKQTPLLASRALELVNEARARGARCGERSFAPAPPVKLSDTLASVAFGHAADMAAHDYFEHEDLAGHSPADRVRAVGYREKLVGENIAYGPESTEEVMRGWLDSPGHCENIMDPRFAEMGIAFAPGHASKRGLYWVQVLAAPRV
jgi:uncharacterized protein YkwD